MRQTNAAKTCGCPQQIQQFLLRAVLAGAVSFGLSGCIGYIAHDPETGTTVNIMGQKVVDPAGKPAEKARTGG
jgi:hypothetical protein